MDMTKDKNYKFILGSIYFFLTFNLLYLFGRGIGLHLNILLQAILVFTIGILIRFLILNPLFLYALLLIATVVILIVENFIYPILPIIIQRNSLLFANIYKNFIGKENIASNNIMPYWFLIIVLINAFTAYILFKKKNIHLLLPIYILVPLIYWYNFYDEAYWTLSIFLILFFILKSLSHNLQENTESPWFKSSLVYGILIISLALVLPKSNKTIYLPWLENKIAQHLPIIYELRSYDQYSRSFDSASDFDISITGFQEDPSQLGGPIILSDKKVMSIYGTKKDYFRGKVKQTYTGNTWKSEDSAKSKRYFSKELTDLTMDEINLFYEELNIKIRNHSFASNTIFSPYRPIKIYIDNNSNLTVNKDEIYFTQEGIYNNEAYNLQVARPLPYGKLLSLKPEKRKKDIEDIDIYLQIPENKITKNTINLVKRIVKDLDGDFEKSKAIENYLRENYDYTTEVDQVPEGYDFIDYFLFQSQEGYCTYFASSLAIMLRLEGIPTRYVEGYLAHEISQEGVLEVRQRNAHAWVEAFIEPVGWMIFEATPPFPIEDRLESYSSLSQNSDLDREENSSIYNSFGTDYDYLENHEDFYIIETGDYPSTESSYKSFFKYLFYIIIILLSLLPLKFIYTAIYISYRKYIARNLNNHEKTIFLYSQILKLIENLGYPQQTGETHLEYAHRIVRRFYTNIDTDADINIKTVVNIFMKAKYGEIPINDYEIDKLLEFKNMLEKQLKFYWGKPAYYFRKYLRLKEYFIY